MKQRSLGLGGSRASPARALLKGTQKDECTTHATTRAGSRAPPKISAMENTRITANRVPTSQRAEHVSKIFGARFLWIESFAFDTANGLSENYDGGHWNYFSLSNDGFYMAPSCADTYRVSCDNGFDGTLSADAFGITACLYAYSQLSFSPDNEFSQICADHYHCLRAFAMQHGEANAILAATD
jgi:hypothetical protein